MFQKQNMCLVQFSIEVLLQFIIITIELGFMELSLLYSDNVKIRI